MTAEEQRKVKWDKSRDFMDGSPRYSMEGRDPSNSIKDIQVVIYRVREPEYRGGPNRYVYYGSIFERQSESGDRLGPFRKVRDAKKAMEMAFFRYQELHPEAS